MNFLLHFMLATLVFAAIDFIWLGFIAHKLYRNLIGRLLLDKFNMSSAVVFYLIFIFGLVVFALQPALIQATLFGAAWHGALFGFICYATYDLTNLATLKHWSLKLSIIDMAWGTVLSGAVVSICYLVFER